MIAVDTNVWARLLITDDTNQSSASLRLLSTQQIFIADSVLLEAEWVLRAAFELPPAVVCAAFRRLCGLPNVHLANAARMAQVIDWHESGLDFAVVRA